MEKISNENGRGGKDMLNRSWAGTAGETGVVGGYWPDGKAKKRNARTHAHHIVLKKGGGGAAETIAFQTRQILWKISNTNTGAEKDAWNPFKGYYNLVWAPNWSHNTLYVAAVYSRLNEVKAGGATAVKEELMAIARDFIKGVYTI